jgi:hypothetical protein
MRNRYLEITDDPMELLDGNVNFVPSNTGPNRVSERPLNEQEQRQLEELTSRAQISRIRERMSIDYILNHEAPDDYYPLGPYAAGPYPTGPRTANPPATGPRTTGPHAASADASDRRPASSRVSSTLHDFDRQPFGTPRPSSVRTTAAATTSATTRGPVRSPTRATLGAPTRRTVRSPTRATLGAATRSAATNAPSPSDRLRRARSPSEDEHSPEPPWYRRALATIEELLPAAARIVESYNTPEQLRYENAMLEILDGMELPFNG